MATKTVGHKERSDFNGLTTKQVALILEEIVCSASMLADLSSALISDPTGEGGLDVSTSAGAARALAERIGMLADHALGQACRGGVEDWMMGPLFAELGQRARSTAE
jgi:hypothetical protein